MTNWNLDYVLEEVIYIFCAFNFNIFSIGIFFIYSLVIFNGINFCRVSITLVLLIMNTCWIYLFSFYTVNLIKINKYKILNKFYNTCVHPQYFFFILMNIIIYIHIHVCIIPMFRCIYVKKGIKLRT